VFFGTRELAADSSPRGGGGTSSMTTNGLAHWRIRTASFGSEALVKETVFALIEVHYVPGPDRFKPVRHDLITRICA